MSATIHDPAAGRKSPAARLRSAGRRRGRSLRAAGRAGRSRPSCRPLRPQRPEPAARRDAASVPGGRDAARAAHRRRKAARGTATAGSAPARSRPARRTCARTARSTSRSARRTRTSIAHGGPHARARRVVVSVRGDAASSTRSAPYDFGGRLTTPFTAHPKRCPRTGELHAFGMQRPRRRADVPSHRCGRHAAREPADRRCAARR